MKSRKKNKIQSFEKSISFSPNNPIERDLFLNLSAKIIKDADAVYDTSHNKIEITLRGQKEEISSLISSINNIQNQIISANRPDKNNYYTFNEKILSQLFNPPLSFDLYSSCLEALGFITKFSNAKLTTDANITDLKNIHPQILNYKSQLSRKFNKDIEKFLISMSVLSKTNDIENIIDISIQSNIIKKTDYDYQFTMSIELASKSLLDALEIDILPTLTQHPDDSLNSEEMSQLAFEGGKIIFTKKGKEINPFENTKQ